MALAGVVVASMAFQQAQRNANEIAKINSRLVPSTRRNLQQQQTTNSVGDEDDLFGVWRRCDGMPFKSLDERKSLGLRNAVETDSMDTTTYMFRPLDSQGALGSSFVGGIRCNQDGSEMDVVLGSIDIDGRLTTFVRTPSPVHAVWTFDDPQRLASVSFLKLRDTSSEDGGVSGDLYNGDTERFFKVPGIFNSCEDLYKLYNDEELRYLANDRC